MNEMDEMFEIPLPVLFNAFKHHRNFILNVVRNESPDYIVALLEPPCNNYVDVYFGEMTPNAIACAIISALESGPCTFARWAEDSMGYRRIILDDLSEWIIRKSDNPERYVHIHPARTGPYTLRFRGSTLKTICLLNSSRELFEPLILGTVNSVRAK